MIGFYLMFSSPSDGVQIVRSGGLVFDFWLKVTGWAMNSLLLRKSWNEFCSSALVDL